MSKRPNRSDPPSVKRRSAQIATWTIACLGFLGLLAGGVIGRNAVRSTIHLTDLTSLTGHLQQQLDTAQLPVEQLAAVAYGPAMNRVWEPTFGPQVKAAANALKARLADFESTRRPSSVVDQELRIGRATVANFERRYSNALEVLAAFPIEPPENTGASVPLSRRTRVLQIRGDSHYGLRQWREAADLYQQVLAAKPNRLDVLARIAESQSALGDLGEARSALARLATGYRQRGDASLAQGDPAAAQASLDKAVVLHEALADPRAGPVNPTLFADRIRSRRHRGYAFMASAKLDEAIADFSFATTQLINQDQAQSSATSDEDLAACHHARGDALLGQGKLDPAIQAFASAIGIRTRLVEQAGRRELAGELARSHQSRGNALLAQGKPDSAVTNFNGAIQVLTPLVEAGARWDLVDDLARSLNNRGVALRAMDKTEESSKEFDSALALLARASGPSNDGRPVGVPAASTGVANGVPTVAVNLELAMSHTETSVEALVRTRILEHDQPKELAILRAVALRNLGYTQLVLGKIEPAIRNFEQSIEIHSRQVWLEGERDLTTQLAKCLGTLAWVHATRPEPNIRDGRKALEYAGQACLAADWRSGFALEAMAAASAEIGDFTNAVRWQEKALELTPAKTREDALRRLALYKSGKPYRAPGG